MYTWITCSWIILAYLYRMQANEYLRRKLQAMPKVIQTSNKVDGRTYIESKRYQIITQCCPTPTVYPINIPCVTPMPEVSTATPADSYLGIKPAAYYSNKCPVISGAPPTLTAPACCTTPGNINTLWANNVPVILSPNAYPSTSNCC